MYLIDSDILIDAIRFQPTALTFLENLQKRERNIALLTQFELLKGCMNKEQESRLNIFLRHFTILRITESVEKTALELYRVKRWSIGIGIVDSFIAATAIVHKYQIVSRNKKHYQNIAQLKIYTPY